MGPCLSVADVAQQALAGNPQVRELMRAAGNPNPSQQDVEQVRDSVKADVYMFSGCKDEQTSADVGNVQTFGLPPATGPGGAGGACTNALLAQAYEEGQESWLKVLKDMVGFLTVKGYTQRPMLSTSKEVDLNTPFSIVGGQPGRKLALLIGINYATHSSGKLNGCVNDVVSMKSYITRLGFQENTEDMKIIVDVPHSHIQIPTSFPKKDEILAGIDWLVSQARPGDSLFFHYSGHGAQQDDADGDEADGKDEVLVPEDYQTKGLISDDELFLRLVNSLPEGVRLVAVMDCCHSGTILDLPYCFQATGESIAQAEHSGGAAHTTPNPNFNAVAIKLLKFGAQALSSKYPGVSKMALQGLNMLG